jgi:hypothetical protein
MQQPWFPWLAAGIGLLLALLLLQATGTARAEPLLPELMLLFMSEFGFLVTLAGAWIGGRSWLAQRDQWAMLLLSFACGVMALGFLYLGVVLWTDIAPAGAAGDSNAISAVA